uniref:hypothetical protein n=1 Tax=Nocardioides sp. TaxID=35761 RepID=UPI003561CEB9
LHTAASPLAASALSFMLDQQCAAGFFRSSFSAKAAPDQTCDGAVAPTPNVDTTGLSVLMLADQSANLEVQSGITSALDWLVSQQASDGSFNNGNANSTGLAGWALGLSGRTGPAAKAAGWLRAHQLANAGSCAPYAAKDNGAVMLDDLGYAGAASGPLDPVEQSVATRATAQSLPALLWAAGGANAGETVLTGPSDFVAAGTTQEVSILGAPGNTVCFTAGGVSSTVVLDESGAGSSAVTMPSKSRTVSVGSVDAGGETDTVSITGLAKKTLKVSLAKVKVKKGSKVVVKIRGLAPGESVKGKVGAKSAKTTANRKGRATLRIVAKKVAKTKVIAVGEFTNRRGKVFVTVIR